MKTTDKKTLAELVAGGLRKAATELEELQVQAALGKAEAKDLFEDVKKNLHSNLQQLKIRIRQKKSSESLLPIVNAIEHLQVQLALGEAETREKFEEQRKILEAALNKLEASLKPPLGSQIIIWHLKIEKFKAKLKLLSLTYNLKKIELQFNLEQRKKNVERTLENMKERLEHKKMTVKNNWSDFKTEVKDAYGNLTHHLLPNE